EVWVSPVHRPCCVSPPTARASFERRARAVRRQRFRVLLNHRRLSRRTSCWQEVWQVVFCGSPRCPWRSRSEAQPLQLGAKIFFARGESGGSAPNKRDLKIRAVISNNQRSLPRRGLA